jgi:hypothetical protein
MIFHDIQSSGLLASHWLVATNRKRFFILLRQWLWMPVVCTICLIIAVFAGLAHVSLDHLDPENPKDSF